MRCLRQRLGAIARFRPGHVGSFGVPLALVISGRQEHQSPRESSTPPGLVSPLSDAAGRILSEVHTSGSLGVEYPRRPRLRTCLHGEQLDHGTLVPGRLSWVVRFGQFHSAVGGEDRRDRGHDRVARRPPVVDPRHIDVHREALRASVPEHWREIGISTPGHSQTKPTVWLSHPLSRFRRSRRHRHLPATAGTSHGAVRPERRQLSSGQASLS
jgi:hypothetical protein